MELPQPLDPTLIGTVTTTRVLDEKVVMAFAGAGADPKQVARDFLSLWRKTFQPTYPRARDRVPDRLTRDAWVWATYHALHHEKAFNLNIAHLLNEPERDISRYARIAELHCMLFPHEAKGRSRSRARQAYMDRLIPTLRKRRHRFRRWLARTLTEPLSAIA
jgi:hypothetical protein